MVDAIASVQFSTLSVHVQKHGRGVVNMLMRHNERVPGQRHSNENIDDSRTDDNIVLERWADGLSYEERIDDVLEKHYAGKRAPRKDAKCLVGVSVNLGNWIATQSEEAQVEVLRFMHEWLKGRYGYVISSSIHLDETTPHLHFDLVPLTDDGRLSAKDLFDKGQLKSLQEDSLKAIQARFPDANFRRLKPGERMLSNGVPMDAYADLKAKEDELREALKREETEAERRVEEFLRGREAELDLREQEVAREAQEASERLSDALEREKELDGREGALRASQSAFGDKVKENNAGIAKVKAQFDERAKRLDARGRQLTAREDSLRDFEQALDLRGQEVAREAQEASERLSDALEREKELEEREEALRASQSAFEALREKVRRLQERFVAYVELWKDDHVRMSKLVEVVERHSPLEENLEAFGDKLAELEGEGLSK